MFWSPPPRVGKDSNYGWGPNYAPGIGVYADAQIVDGTVAAERGPVCAPLLNNGQVTVQYETFIPMQTVTDRVGRTYAGDNRSFEDGGTYRASQVVVIDTGRDKVSYTWSDTGISKQLDSRGDVVRTGQADPTSGFSATGPTARADGSAEYRMSGHSTNPLATTFNISYAPAIDYEVTIRTTPSGVVVLQAAHDGFPAHHLMVNGQSVYSYDPRSVGNGPMSLFPPLDVRSPPVVIPARR